MKSRTSILLLALLFSFAAQAQYPFASKKEQKLYEQLESYYNDYDYESILDEEETILELFESKQDTLTALMYSFLSEGYYYVGATDMAYDYSKKEFDLRQQVDADNTEGIKNIVFLLTQYADEMGLFEEAEGYYNDLLESDRKTYGAKSEQYIQTALSAAQHYGYVNTFDELRKGVRLLRPISRGLADEDPVKPATFSQLGYLYGQLGSRRQAERHFEEAVAAYDIQGRYASRESALTLNDYAIYLQSIGDYPSAEKAQTEALSIVERLPGDNSDVQDVVHGNIAKTYLAMGNYEAAEESLLASIELAKEFYGEGSYNEVISTIGLGLSYRRQEKWDLAEEKYSEALATLESLGANSTFEYFTVINNLGNVYKDKGDLNKALEYSNTAVQGFKEVSGSRSQTYAKSIYNLGEIYMMRGESEKGEAYLKEAQKIVQTELGEFHPEYARMTIKLAINQWDQENFDDAQELYSEVFANYFQQLESYFPTLSEEEKTKFYNNKIKPAFEQFNSFLVEMSRDDEPLLGLMYDYQLATKGLLFYATNKVRAAILNSGDSLLIEKYETWVDQKEQLSKLYSSTSESLDDRNQKIDSLTQTANQLEKELGEASSVFAGAYTQGQKTWRDVKAELEPGEAAIEMIRFRNFKPSKGGEYTDEVFYGALIVTSETENHPQMVLLRNGAEMENRFLSNYRNAIKFKMDEDYSYRLFWRPIANRLGDIKKVYFSPDGVYNQISIYTLLNSATGKFLIDEIDLKIITNTKDLTLSDAGTTNGTGRAYLFGYPNYNLGVIEDDVDREALASEVAQAVSQGRGDSREVRGTRGGSRGGRGGDAGTRSFGDPNGGGLSRGLRGNLQRYMSGGNLMALLPGTKVEVESIAEIYSKAELDPALFLSNEATEQEIKTVNNPRTLHIATHGFFLESEKLEEAGGEVDTYVENPLLRSGLILAGANSFIASGQISEEYDDGEDGILTAYEAMNLNLDNTDLVVLSACETGLGEVSNGEGVYGLQRAFQVAGAESIIMSMWTVDDAATQELMTNFYNEWIKTGDKQKAFVSAQKILKEKWKAPYYWGAFVMVGQ